MSYSPQIMAKLWPLEVPNDPTVGGFAVLFPSGACKAVVWHSQAPIPDSLDAAKSYVTQLVDACLKLGLIDDLERTNMPSLTAAAQRLIDDWSERTKLRLYAERGLPPATG